MPKPKPVYVNIGANKDGKPRAARYQRGLMEDVGWKSVNSAVRYAHVVTGETTAAVDKLPSVQISSSSNVKPLKDRRIRKKNAS